MDYTDIMPAIDDIQLKVNELTEKINDIYSNVFSDGTNIMVEAVKENMKEAVFQQPTTKVVGLCSNSSESTNQAE